MTLSQRYTRVEIDGFSRAVKASRERATALKRGSQAEDATAALAHMEVVVEELAVADEELRVQTEALEQAQLDLEMERRRYVDFFDSAPDPYVVTDVNGIVVEANSAAGSCLGVPTRFLAGKPLANHVALTERKRFRAVLDEAAYSDTTHQCEIELLGRNREPVRFEARVARVRHERAPELRWLLRDLSPRGHNERTTLHHEAHRPMSERIEQLEQALEQERAARARAVTADQATVDFVARLSHELRTPLQAAVGYVDILKQEIHGRVNMAQAAALERIVHAHQHMGSLLDSVLEIGRMRAGRVTLHLGDVPLDPVLARVEELVTPSIVSRGLSCAIVSRTPAATRVHADRTKLEQILLNLLTNAVRYTSPGGSITVTASTRDATVAIEVRDTGPGIPAEQLDMVFEPFVRLSSDSASTASEGAGLGLAISRELARLMKGDLTVTSELGSGSAFTLTLPLSAPAGSAA